MVHTYLVHNTYLVSYCRRRVRPRSTGGTYLDRQRYTVFGRIRFADPPLKPRLVEHTHKRTDFFFLDLAIRNSLRSNNCNVYRNTYRILNESLNRVRTTAGSSSVACNVFRSRVSQKCQKCFAQKVLLLLVPRVYAKNIDTPHSFIVPIRGGGVC